MLGLRTPELLLILLLLVVLFGARKLPELGKGLGEGIRSFRKAFRGHEEEDAPSSPPPQGPTETK